MTLPVYTAISRHQSQVPPIPILLVPIDRQVSRPLHLTCYFKTREVHTGWVTSSYHRLQLYFRQQLSCVCPFSLFKTLLDTFCFYSTRLHFRGIFSQLVTLYIKMFTYKTHKRLYYVYIMLCFNYPTVCTSTFITINQLE